MRVILAVLLAVPLGVLVAVLLAALLLFLNCRLAAWWLRRRRRIHVVINADAARMFADMRAEAVRTPPPEAHVRANAFLESFLDDEQRAQFREVRSFDVTVRDRTYRISGGSVYRFTKGNGRDKYCIGTRRHYVPDADNMLAQKLLLETNERQFLRTANKIG